jgi:hypothetical protein
MKLRLVILLILISISVSSNAQFLTLNSADSLNGKPKRMFYTTAWVKLNGIWDYMGISNTAAMNLTDIPTDGRAPDSHFTMDMYQTRLIFASAFQTKKFGEIFSYIETDFYGNNGGGLRMRHAYIRFKNFRIGQTWSSFTDEESWPNVTDFDGPPTGTWVRHVQLGYFIRPSESIDILISVESPFADYNRYLQLDSTLQNAAQTLPDLHTHFEKRWAQGHVQLAFVYRFIEYKDAADKKSYISGYGFSLSSTQIIGKRDKLIGQLVGGKGISRYLVSLGGSGWDAAPDSNGSLVALPVWGGYFSYQHYWSKSDFSSTTVLGYSTVDNPFNQPTEHLFNGFSATLNVYWQPLGPLSFAVEGIYGTHTDEIDRFGDNIRIQFVFEYSF